MSVFRVSDIHCDGCVRSLAAAARELDAGATVQADLQTKLVTVKTNAPPDAVAEAFRDAGFTVEAA
ncbi:heavy-metal-associated domain-containing protein [Rhodopila sp.]|jgi:copper chaperone|uniref:heavy-metal-associated domain-containing protein n=1 Tax=Rhodopila sp. TaxID=2480087 RepID=UPI002BF66FED|nr:heavy-metal-associated domain-containing protein [Rhodopila sp.]HVZ07189.1 heavy-metal-associated domain-containing protein [Rhodopila sp.]